MSADLFKLSGTYGSQPASGIPSGEAQVGPAPISEKLALAHKHYDDPKLVSDSAYSLQFGAVTKAAVVIVKSDRPVTMKVTLQIGATTYTDQVLAVDSFFVNINQKYPYTAITFVRDAGKDTQLEVFLGEV